MAHAMEDEAVNFFSLTEMGSIPLDDLRIILTIAATERTRIWR
jgi:hypothetical protein